MCDERAAILMTRRKYNFVVRSYRGARVGSLHPIRKCHGLQMQLPIALLIAPHVYLLFLASSFQYG